MKAHKEDEAVEQLMLDMKRNSQNQAVKRKSVMSLSNGSIQKA